MTLPCCSADAAMKHEFKKLVDEYMATSTVSNPQKKRKLTHAQEHFLITRLYSAEGGKWMVCQKHFQDLTGAKNPGRLRSRLVRQRDAILSSSVQNSVPRKPKDPAMMQPPSAAIASSSSSALSSPSSNQTRRRIPCVSCKKCLPEWTAENLKQKKNLFRSLAKDEKFGLSACSKARKRRGKVRKNQLSTAEKRFLVNHLFDDEGQSLMCQKCFRHFTGLKSTKTLVKRVRFLIVTHGRALLDLNPTLLQHRRAGKSAGAVTSETGHPPELSAPVSPMNHMELMVGMNAMNPMTALGMNGMGMSGMNMGMPSVHMHMQGGQITQIPMSPPTRSQMPMSPPPNLNINHPLQHMGHNTGMALNNPPNMQNSQQMNHINSMNPMQHPMSGPAPAQMAHANMTTLPNMAHNAMAHNMPHHHMQHVQDNLQHQGNMSPTQISHEAQINQLPPSAHNAQLAGQMSHHQQIHHTHQQLHHQMMQQPGGEADASGAVIRNDGPYFYDLRPEGQK